MPRVDCEGCMYACGRWVAQAAEIGSVVIAPRRVLQRWRESRDDADERMSMRAVLWRVACGGVDEWRCAECMRASARGRSAIRVGG